MEIRRDYYPEEIALAMCSLADGDFENFDEYGEQNPMLVEMEDVLYQLMAAAQNQYNKDYYRTIWNVMQDITDRWDRKEIG